MHAEIKTVIRTADWDPPQHNQTLVTQWIRVGNHNQTLVRSGS
jgi:hypothetical protein